MKVYSASEAIWPALRRTYFYLFRPMQWELFLKLASVATVCEGFVVSFRFSVPDVWSPAVSAQSVKAYLLARDFLPVTVFGAVALVLGGVYAFYLLTQLRFAFFHSLVHQTTRIRKAARLYPVETEGLFTAGVLVWTALLAGVMLLAALVIAAGYTVMASPTANGRLDPGNFLILFFPCIGFAFALLVAICAAHVILNDFILPHMAVEGSTFKKAWAQVRARIAGNKETFLSYFILRMGMPVFAGVVLALLGWLVGLAAFGFLGMSAAGFNAMLAGATGIGAYLLEGIHGLFVALGLVSWALIAVALGGPLGVFMRCFALYYYGGHFAALGNLMEPRDV